MTSDVYIWYYYEKYLRERSEKRYAPINFSNKNFTFTTMYFQIYMYMFFNYLKRNLYKANNGCCHLIENNVIFQLLFTTLYN